MSQVYVGNGSGGGGSSGITSVNIQTFSSSGTYTPTTGMVDCIIEAVGGGAAGGGAATTTFSVGSGGGNGEYRMGRFTAAQIGASKAVTIGAGGAGVIGDAGSDGGTTSVGALISAIGGKGGIVLSSNTNSYMTHPGGVGGTGGTGGDLSFDGADGGFCTIYSPLGLPEYVISGMGNSGPFTGGAPPVTVVDGAVVQSEDGNDATGFGGGGSGAIDYVNSTAQTGGDGSSGLVKITEYIA